MFLSHYSESKKRTMPDTKQFEAKYLKELKDLSWYTITVLKCLGLWSEDVAIVNAHNALTFLQMTFGLLIVFLDMYVAYPDLVESIKYSCFFFALLLPTIKMINFMYRHHKIMQMYSIIVNIFWKDLGNHADNQNLVIKYARRGWLLVTIITVMTFVTGSLATLLPLVTMLQEQRAGLPVLRRLPFPLYLPFGIDTEASPIYELLFIGMSLLLAFTLFVIPIFDNIFIILVMNTAGHFKVLSNNIKLIGTNADGSIEAAAFDVAMEKELYADFCICIKKHCLLLQFGEDLETIFTFQLFLQYGVSSLFLCLCGIQIVTVKNNPVALILFVSYFITSLLQLFVYCWTCYEIFNASCEVCDAVYACGWMRARGRGWRPNICLCIARAQRPTALTAGGFYPITLETFTTILSSAGSYFTLLTTVMEDKLSQ